MNVQIARNDRPVEFVSKGINDAIWKRIYESSPSDHICMDYREDSAICSLWQHDSSKVENVPSDIFFAGTIPLLDCMITVDESNCILRNGMHGLKTTCRFVIFKDYKERAFSADDNLSGIVGAMILELDGHKIAWPIHVDKGCDYIMCGRLAYDNYTHEMLEKYQHIVSQKKACQQMLEWMTTWYGIQIALLHPTVKTIFQHPEDERIYNPNTWKKKNKRVTCYVKKHVIKPGDVESAMHGGERNFTRKTMVWYVIGHWRTYSDGRKVFVRPYWKGPLRELKQNIDDGRERQIVLGGGIDG